MKIAFYLDNTHIPSIDFRNPALGNLGSGASEYIQVAAPFFLDKYYGTEIEAIILAPHIEKLPPELYSDTANNIKEAAEKAKKYNVDFFIFRARQSDDEGIIDFIDSISLPSIGVAQLTPVPKILRKMARSSFFKALVCVGLEQYDFLIDSPIKPKLAYIDNGLHVESCWADASHEKKDPKLVVYMGALVPVKGFHQLAEAWPKILKEVPDARLSVIGSIKMYGDNLTVGPLGVASDDYERKYIIPYLCDSNGQVHPSVTFHGQMGKEKFSILRHASIGIANPTGQTETCCVSAIEMSACKTAVVSGAYYALLDTVLHNKTGLLGRGVDALAKNICKLLSNSDLAKNLGQAGYERAFEQYDFFATSRRWIELLESLEIGKMPKSYGKLKNIFYHFKLLRIFNYFFQAALGRFFIWPSLYECEIWARKKLSSLRL